MLDNAPFVSPRAHGAAGAITTSADNMDAFYYNPAGIAGHVYQGKAEKQPFVRQVLFPRLGLTLNENAQKLNQEFSANGSTTNANIGAATIKTQDGKRQYARFSVTPVALFLGNLGVAPVIDQQIAAVPINNETSDVELRHRSFSGAMVGSGFTDSKGYFSFGVSSAIGTIEETYATAPYIDIVDVKKRSEIVSANSKTYTASGINAGVTIRHPHKVNPTFSVVARDMGTTKNQASDDSDPLLFQEDLTTAFGISPALGKFGRLNLAMEGGYLTDPNTASQKKIRASLELLLGKTDGSRSLLGLRAGGTAAGASFGVHLNLGLIGIEASSHVVDAGLNNEKLIERRTSVCAYIDVASF